MKRYAHIGFICVAVLNALNGVRGMVSGDSQRAALGLAMSVFWLIFAVAIKRRQQRSAM
jgi:hypothetical protein